MTVVTQHRATSAGVNESLVASGGSYWETLDASRRSDWRFLLPGLRLGKVAYLGPSEGALHESLTRFSDALTVNPDDPDETVSRNVFDTVVCTGESEAAARNGMRLVCPGGFLYVELDRRHATRRLLSRGSRQAGQLSQTPDCDVPRTAAEWVRQLQHSGFEDIRLHWHWPNFDSCLEMVRLDDRAALLHAVSRRGSGPSARFKAAMARALIDIGLFPRVARCISVLARRPELKNEP